MVRYKVVARRPNPTVVVIIIIDQIVKIVSLRVRLAVAVAIRGLKINRYVAGRGDFCRKCVVAVKT